MSATISPKQLADAIGVSESSLRRWADDGRITVVRTAGGHRRIPVPNAVQFVREMRMPLQHPEILGLQDLHGLDEGSPGTPSGQLFEHLQRGRIRESRAIVVKAYMEGQSVAQIVDELLQPAMERIGRLWHDGPIGIAIEHAATDGCLSALSVLHGMVVPPADDEPVAIGGAPTGEHYSLASTAAATVLAEAGFREVNLGANVPSDAMVAAIHDTRPALVWMCLKAERSAKAVREAVAPVADAARETGSAVVLGGRDVSASVLNSWQHVHLLANMRELASFAHGLLHREQPGGG